MSGNLPRILPAGLGAAIDRDSCHTTPIFQLIQKKGRVSEEEMYRVFNMGIGMVIICNPSEIKQVKRKLPELQIIGKVIKTKKSERVIIK